MENRFEVDVYMKAHLASLWDAPERAVEAQLDMAASRLKDATAGEIERWKDTWRAKVSVERVRRLIAKHEANLTKPNRSSQSTKPRRKSREGANLRQEVRRYRCENSRMRDRRAFGQKPVSDR